MSRDKSLRLICTSPKPSVTSEGRCVQGPIKQAYCCTRLLFQGREKDEMEGLRVTKLHLPPSKRMLQRCYSPPRLFCQQREICFGHCRRMENRRRIRTERKVRRRRRPSPQHSYFSFPIPNRIVAGNAHVDVTNGHRYNDPKEMFLMEFFL